MTKSSAYTNEVTRGALGPSPSATPGQAARTAAATLSNNRLNNSGPDTLPCLTPACSDQGSEKEPFTETRAVVSVIKSAMTINHHRPQQKPVSRERHLARPRQMLYAHLQKRRMCGDGHVIAASALLRR